MANTLTSRLVRVTIQPDAYDYQACINAKPRSRSIDYRLNFDGPGEMKIRKIRLVGSGARFFTYAGPATVARQGPGNLLTFSISFRPEKARTYRARLKVHYILYRPDGSILSIWSSVMLTGTGTLCPVPGAPPAGGLPPAGPGGAVGGNGLPAPGGGTPAGEGDPGDTPDGDDGAGPEDGDTSDSEGEASGGSDPGGTVAGPGLKELTVCVRFRKVRGAWDELDAARLDTLLARVNSIWSRAGIKFTRADRAFETVNGPPVNFEKLKPDPHCLDIFIGGDDLIDTIGAAHPEGGIPDGVEAHERFRKKGAYCSNGGYVQLEYGSAPPAQPAGGETPANAPHQVLAHELGHALGLGPAPDPNASPQEHLDPTTGEPITSRKRLMHPESGGGTGLTDHEVRVARKVQEYVKGGQPRYSGCNKTSKYIYEPREDRSGLFLGAGLRSFPEQLSAYLRVSRDFPLSDGLRFGIDLDLYGEGEPSWRAEYTRQDGQWYLRAPAAERSFDAPALTAPRALLKADAAPSEFEHPVQGFAIDLPKNRIGRHRGMVGWRIWGDFKALGTFQLPAKGMETLDITPPQMFLELETQQPVVMLPKTRLVLSGRLTYSSSFSGAPEIACRLAGNSTTLAGRQLKPSAETWAIELEMPPLDPGNYTLWIDAGCKACGVETSLPVALVIK